MALRTAILATAFFGTLTTIYHLSSSSSQILFNMSPNQAPLGDVAISLSSAQSPLTVKVTIRNDSPDKTFSFLTWDSPFDPQAINTGVLCLKDAVRDALKKGLEANNVTEDALDGMKASLQIVQIAHGGGALYNVCPLLSLPLYCLSS